MVRFLCTGDWHGKRTYPKRVFIFAKKLSADAILCTGDIVHKTSLDDAISLLSEIKLPIFFVPGNTDPPELAIYENENVHSVHGKIVEFKGIKIAGVGASPPTPFESTYVLEESEISKFLDEYNPDILLTHAPPAGTKLEITWKRARGGSTAIAHHISRFKPPVAICGHVHEAWGYQKIGTTLCVNVGSLPHAFFLEMNGSDVLSARFVRIPPLRKMERI